MADEAAAAAEESEIEAKPKKGMSGKKLVLFIILPILLLGGGGAGAFFMGLLDPLLGIEKVAEGEGLEGEEAEAAALAEQEAQAAAFFDLPEMLVNLNSSGSRTSYLKVSISLELADEDVAKELEAVIPRIVDNFQVYLRELRVEDLEGSAGLQRLREELLLRVHASARNDGVRDVLFKEMLVQ